MKKLVLISFLLTAFAVYSHAQFSAGGGLSYGTEIEKFGITGKGLYTLNENIDISGALTIFFPEKSTFTNPFGPDTEIKTTLWELNFDGHYNFPASEEFVFYPMAGINITGIRTKVEADGSSDSDSDTEFGLNIGAGGVYAFSEKLKGFAEIKYVISDYDQAVFTFGVLFPLQ